MAARTPFSSEAAMLSAGEVAEVWVLAEVGETDDLGGKSRFQNIAKHSHWALPILVHPETNKSRRWDRTLGWPVHFMP